MRIYLDHNATTPVRSEVADVMDVVQREVYGNPSSVHVEGSSARAEIDRARARIVPPTIALEARWLFHASLRLRFLLKDAPPGRLLFALRTPEPRQGRYNVAWGFNPRLGGEKRPAP